MRAKPWQLVRVFCFTDSGGNDGFRYRIGGWGNCSYFMYPASEIFDRMDTVLSIYDIRDVQLI